MLKHELRVSAVSQGEINTCIGQCCRAGCRHFGGNKKTITRKMVKNSVVYYKTITLKYELYYSLNINILK